MIGVWPPLPPGVYLRRAGTVLPFPLDSDDCTLYARARHGLWQGVRALGLEPGDAVLVPAYHHGSEVEAFVRAGLECRFYDGGDDLAPDEDELESLLDDRVRALDLVHYLGFPQDAARWRRWCDARGLLLFEDAAQAWLSERDGTPAGALGDLAVFCLYKTFGLPDGAAVVARGAPGASAAQGAGLAATAKRHALWAVGRSPLLGRLAAAHRRSGEYDAAADFALGDPDSAPVSAMRVLLPRLVARDAAARRRANYAMLLDEVGELVAPPFAELPEGASPFAFPVETDAKAEVLARLARNGINALDFWSVPHPSLPAERFPRAARRRARTVALPVHQELRPEDVQRIARAVRGGRPRPRAPLTLEPASLASLQEEWTELADHVFATHEWASIWWRHFGRAGDDRIVACRRPDGSLAGVLPLYYWRRRPVRIVRFVGHGPGDELGPVCAHEDRVAVAEALRTTLARLPHDLFVGDELPADAGWGALLGGPAIAHEGSPLLRFEDATWDELLARKSRNLREQVRRRERKLQREHDLRYRLTTDASELERDLDTLFSLHGARWQDGSAFAGATEAFHREFAACAFERGWCRLWILELDGAPAAAWYGFRFGEAESYYQAGRDPRWERENVGFVLLAHTMRSALEDGMLEYRFLRGDEAFKYRFASSDPGLEKIARPQSLAGRAALLGRGAVRHLSELGASGAPRAHAADG